MTALRWIAGVGAIALMLGEMIRSWGTGRPVAFVLDDMIVGAMLLTAAILLARPTAGRRRYFSASWGAAAGMLYGSFFDKVIAPETVTAGNIPIGALTALIGLAFAISVVGLIASIRLNDSADQA